MGKQDNHAIVFGAAGLLGWSVVNQLLSNYPNAGTFSRVTAVVNRPLPESDFHVSSSKSEAGKPEFQVVSGIDLRNGTGDDLARQLRDNVPEADTITHVFYFVFSAFDEDYAQERKINCDMMRRVSTAMNTLSPVLKSFVYGGGTRGYGIYVPGGTFEAPLREELADQLPEEYAKTVAYPWFRKILTEASQSRTWSWTELCPDAVVGFSPNGSGWSLALHWAQYLSLYAHQEKQTSSKEHSQVVVPFPGNEEGFNSNFTPVSGTSLGRIAIFASMNPESCSGKVINIADNDQPTTFRQLWPEIASWFGLIGAGPSQDGAVLKPGEYIAKHKHLFVENGRPKALTCGVGAGSAQLDNVGFWLTFDRQLSLERLRACGFQEKREPIEGWLESFEQLRNAGIIL